MIIEGQLADLSQRGLKMARWNSPFRRFNALGLVLGGMVFVHFIGCGDPDLPPGITKKAVALGEVPGVLLSAAKKEMPSVEFKEAWQNLDAQGKLHSYEIRGQQASNGKVREVRLSLTGEILEKE
jgi:hypothetical protein